MDENHLLDIVDEKDRVIGQATKEEKFQKELISRNVVAFVKKLVPSMLEGTKYKLIIVKRSPKKRSWPGRLDLATCGNVDCGESYEQAIQREIKEELGIAVKLKFIKKLYTEVIENGKKVRYFTGVFLGETDKTPVLSDELLELRFMSIDDLGTKMKSDPDLFSPSFIREFEELKDVL